MNTQRFLGIGLVSYAVILLGSFLSNTVSAVVVNGGFESGDFTGWTITARDITRYGIGGDGSPPLPQEGSYFAYLTADVSPWTEVSQTIIMQTGDKLDGYAYWTPLDSSHEGYVRIYDSTPTPTLVDTPWYKIATAGSTSWEPWTFTASYADTYTLVLGVREPGSAMHSVASFDGTTFTAVPEPATVYSLLLMLVGSVFAVRKCRRA